MISENDVNIILTKHSKVLDEYCYYLAEKYNETLGGDYRIQYNHLASFLHSPVSDKKKAEMFNKLDIKFIDGNLYFL